MYQFCMSINEKNSHWYDETEKSLSVRIKNCNGIMASKACGGRLYISFACENKHKTRLIKVLKEVITEIYLTCVKRNYISDILPLPNLKCESLNVLLYTLVAFDRDAEKEIIERELTIGESLALDGFFNFKLTELKKRWDDIAQLAAANSVYLNNDDTLNELLKFLMSAVSPKIMKLDIIKNEDIYNITGEYMEKSFEYKFLSQDKLMEYLINVAPLELTLHGSFEDDKLYRRLTSIFDVKTSAVLT